MRTQIYQTKKNTYLKADGIIYHKNRDWSNHNFEVCPEEIIIERGVKFEGVPEFEVESISQAYNDFIARMKQASVEVKQHHEEVASKNEQILKDHVTATPSDLLAAIQWAAANNWGFRAADILLADNELSKLLLSKIGSYTVTPFDDCSILVKAGSKRYGVNTRKWASLREMIS